MPEPTKPKSTFRELVGAAFSLLVVMMVLGGIIWGCNAFKPKPRAPEHRCPYCGQEIKVRIEEKEKKK